MSDDYKFSFTDHENLFNFCCCFFIQFISFIKSYRHSTLYQIYRDLTENLCIQHQCFKCDMREENGYFHTILQIWSMGIQTGQYIFKYWALSCCNEVSLECKEIHFQFLVCHKNDKIFPFSIGKKRLQVHIIMAFLKHFKDVF